MAMDAVVIGAGPAGLMAAEVLAAGGARVTVADQMPSPARKLLMAGKSGLNLTKDEPEFFSGYPGLPAPVRAALDQFGPADVMAWAEGLGQPLFTGSTGRVFPVARKASPLLRAWLARLGAMGVRLALRHRWTGAGFDTPDGPVQLPADVVVLAMGGGSWRRLGSDGAWVQALGLPVVPFTASNVGLRVGWSAHMARHFGTPVKPLVLRAAETVSRGEVVVTAKGLEGGGLYPLIPAIRGGARLRLDLTGGWAPERLRSALAAPRGGMSVANVLRKRARLTPVKIALLREFAHPLPQDLSVLLDLPVVHQGLNPLDEAISTAGGLSWDQVDDSLMLRARPGWFAAGEMLDWDAVTGGYLLTACLATGRRAGLSALAYGRARAD